MVKVYRKIGGFGFGNHIGRVVNPFWAEKGEADEGSRRWVEDEVADGMDSRYDSGW